MKEIFILFIKGLIIGIGQIIPGVSGGMLAITFGLYERGVNAISNFFENIKENIKFLFPIGLGILCSVLMVSKAIKYFLATHYLPTMLLFIGLIIGGIPSLITKIKNTYKIPHFALLIEIKNTYNKKNVITLMLIFLLVTMLSLFKGNNNISFDNFSTLTYISLFFVGIIYAATMVIPGVSGTAIMMLIGYYDLILTIISSLTNFSYISNNMNLVTPLTVGFVFGIIIISKLMNYLLKKHETITYYGIIGLVLSSVFVMFTKTFNTSYSLDQIVIGLILLVIGYIVSRKLDKI